MITDGKRRTEEWVTTKDTEDTKIGIGPGPGIFPMDHSEFTEVDLRLPRTLREKRS
jgi:hypothetical protein